MADIIPVEQIGMRILIIRSQRVILDADLAEIYGVTTKVLNQAVKRNIDRFPPEFMFCLTESEKEEVVTNCDHLRKLKYSPVLPRVFTEYGALMLANVLKSPRSIRTSVQIIRAFIRLRQLLLSHGEMARKLETLEKKYDGQFRIVFEAIRRLLIPRRIRGKSLH